MPATIGRAEALAQLDLVMDARAFNLTQERLLAGANNHRSLAAHLAHLVRMGVDPHEVAELTRLCRELLESNLHEGEEERRLAALVEDFIARQLAAPVEQRIRVKSIAAKLRPALRTIRQAAHGPAPDGIEFFKAACVVRDVIAATPPEHLMSRSLAHELKDGPFRLLCDLVQGLAIEEAGA